MKLLTSFCAWFKRMFFPTNFDVGYEWAERELKYGRAPEALLVCSDSVNKTAFDRGIEEAVRKYLVNGHPQQR